MYGEYYNKNNIIIVLMKIVKMRTQDIFKLCSYNYNICVK